MCLCQIIHTYTPQKSKVLHQKHINYFEFLYYDNSCANIKENSGNDNDIVYTHLDN